MLLLNWHEQWSENWNKDFLPLEGGGLPLEEGSAWRGQTPPPPPPARYGQLAVGMHLTIMRTCNYKKVKIQNAITLPPVT